MEGYVNTFLILTRGSNKEGNIKAINILMLNKHREF